MPRLRVVIGIPAALILTVALGVLVRDRMLWGAGRRLTPGATWIGPPCDGHVAVLSRVFTLPFRPTSARLRVGMAPAGALAVNGTVLVRGGLADHDKMLAEVDAGPYLRAGANELTIEVLGAPGLGGAILWLEATDGAGGRARLVSDGSWRSCDRAALVLRGPLGRPWRIVKAPARQLPEPLADRGTELRLVAGTDGLWALPREQVGYPVLRGVPPATRMLFGESRAEALSQAPFAREGVETLDARGVGYRRRAFRFVRLDPPVPGAEVAIRLRGTGGPPRGTFACSDPELDHAYGVAAATIENCLQDVIEDGVKRDRQAWAGDLVVAVPATAYLYGRHETTERTLRWMASGHAANGALLPSYPTALKDEMTDYVGAWLVALASYLMLSPDPALRDELGPVVRAQQRWLEERLASGAIVVPAGTPLQDWMSHTHRAGRVTYQQGMAVLGLDAAARILDDPDAARAADTARTRLAAELERHRLPSGLLADDLDGADFATHDGNVLAVLSGIAGPEPGDVLAVVRARFWTDLGPMAYEERRPDRGALLDGRVIAPFMAGLEAWARFQHDDAAGAVELLRRTWRPMTASGCGYEFLDGDGEPPRIRGREPFWASLCHSWSAAPAWLLPAHVLGVRPVEAGFARFIVAPQRAGLTEAHGDVPLVDGTIHVGWSADGTGTRVEIEAPPGHAGSFDPTGLAGADVITARRDGTAVDGPPPWPVPVGRSVWELSGARVP